MSLSIFVAVCSVIVDGLSGRIFWVRFYIHLKHHLLSQAELTGLHVRSGLQVMVPLPLICRPLGQVTRTDCPTGNSCWEPCLLLTSLQPGGAGHDLAARSKHAGLFINRCLHRVDALGRSAHAQT